MGDGDSDTDYRALKEGRITITPIHYDLTCEEELKRLKGCEYPEGSQWHIQKPLSGQRRASR